MKRKRTIANLLQETNEPATIMWQISSSAPQTKRTDTEKKTFIKEYFDTNSTCDEQEQNDKLIDMEVVANTSETNCSSNVSKPATSERKMFKKSKIKDYVFNNDSSCSTTSSTGSIVSQATIKRTTQTILPKSENLRLNTPVMKKTIGSLINNCNRKNLKTKEKKSKIKDYIQVDTLLDGSSLSNDSQTTKTCPVPQPLISTMNNTNTNKSCTIEPNSKSKLYNKVTKVKRTKIKDYITRANDIVTLANKRLSKTKVSLNIKKMNVKNHLQQNIIEPTDPIINNLTVSKPQQTSNVATANKSTIKEYLQNKNQRNKLINNKENLNELKMTKRLYFRASAKQE